MKYMSHDDIRNTWYRFFEEKGHKVLESASLIPINDNSLLWVNAGVTPLKKYFDGSVVPECKRLVSIQKCIRTNDIENVGVTKRHHTFFEMMGNFSIGDYFKNEAIEYSFELPEEAEARLNVKTAEELMVLTIAKVPNNKPRETTVNLLGPIILNTTNQNAGQVILSGSGFDTNYPLFQNQESAKEGV